MTLSREDNMLAKICEWIVGNVGEPTISNRTVHGEQVICYCVGTTHWYLVPLLYFHWLKSFYGYYLSLAYIKSEGEAAIHLFEKKSLYLYWRVKPELRIEGAYEGWRQLSEVQRDAGMTNEDEGEWFVSPPHPKRWHLYSRLLISENS